MNTGDKFWAVQHEFGWTPYKSEKAARKHWREVVASYKNHVPNESNHWEYRVIFEWSVAKGAPYDAVTFIGRCDDEKKTISISVKEYELN